MRSRAGNIFGDVDWILIGLFFLLTILGWLNLYSASFNENHPSMFDLSQEYGKQFMWIGIITVIGFVILLFEGQFFKTFAYHIYGFCVFLLVAVLLFGAVRNGAKSWFGFGSFGIQPSEFAKFSTGLALAKYLSSTGTRMQDIETKFIAGAIIGLPALLVQLQPDTGTVLVFVSFILVLYREGLSGNILLLGLLSAIISVLALIFKNTEVGVPFSDLTVGGQYVFMLALLIIGGLGVWLISSFVVRRRRRRAFTYLGVTIIGSMIVVFSVNFVFNMMAPHQKDRIELLLGLKVDKQKGYNVNQAMAAIGSGGMIGKGYQQGTLSNNKYKWVPMQSTDFIFCSIGEEWGFLGTTFYIVVFILFLLRIIFIAERQRSNFTRIYGYATACILFFHFMINVGMAIGLAPVIGIPLPFFSYGGSSLLGFALLVFIFIKLDSERLTVLR